MVVDQAAELRKLVRSRLSRAKVVAVTSGKGGVGKTNLAIGYALACAQLGRKVILVDMDLGMANIDVLLNLRSKYNLSHVIAGWKDVSEVLVDGPGGIQVLPGASGLHSLADMDSKNRNKLIKKLESLEQSADVIVIDTGAGISSNVIKFILSADEIIVVTTPEPTAITDAFAVLKVLKRCEDKGLQLGDIQLLVNMAHSKKEAELVADSLIVNSKRFQNLYVEKLGYILHDPKVQAAVRKRRHFYLDYPGSVASSCLRNVMLNQYENGSKPRAQAGFFKRLSTLFRKG